MFLYTLQTLKLKLYIYFTLALLSLSIYLLKKSWAYLKKSQELDPYCILYYFKYKLEF